MLILPVDVRGLRSLFQHHFLAEKFKRFTSFVPSNNAEAVLFRFKIIKASLLSFLSLENYECGHWSLQFFKVFLNVIFYFFLILTCFVGLPGHDSGSSFVEHLDHLLVVEAEVDAGYLNILLRLVLGKAAGESRYLSFDFFFQEVSEADQS